jgi:hypothetical protein
LLVISNTRTTVYEFHFLSYNRSTLKMEVPGDTPSLYVFVLKGTLKFHLNIFHR